MLDDSGVRAYFDSRARPFDRLYENGPGLRGRFDAWVYGRVRLMLELTLAELGDLTGRTLLDIGCGPGRYAVAAAERGARVLGVDLSPEMLALARRRAHDRGVEGRCRFLQSDFDAFEPTDRFDVGLMISFVEYRPALCHDLARLHDLVTEKALVTIPVPGRWQTVARRARHRLRAAPPSLYLHRQAAVATCLREAGFDAVRCDRGWFVAHCHGSNSSAHAVAVAHEQADVP